jgi:hypothetical protein
MRIVASFGPLCFCALFFASLWGTEGVGWTETNLKTTEAFNWKNGLAPGKTLKVQNLNGPINVTPSSGSDVEVRAQVRYSTSDPKAIRFEVKSDDHGVRICALWPGMDRCDAPGKNVDKDMHDLEVDFDVRLPGGILVETVSVNGDVSVRGATEAVRATTVNGAVRVETRGAPITASTVNGHIEVLASELNGDGEIKLATVNGDITAKLPSRFDAEVSARTLSGSISVLGKDYQDRVRTTVGRGGRRLSADTVNGSIAIR